MIKKDIRYIIKKVIIYVLVALILGFIGKNNVFADSVNSICSPNTNVSTTCSTTDFNYDNPVPIPTLNLQYVPKNGSGNYRYFLQTALYNEEREIYHFNNVRYYDNIDDDMLNFVWKLGNTQNNVNFYIPWAGESSGNVPNSIIQTYDYFIVESGSANETWLINQLNLFTDSHFTGTWYARSTFNLGGKLYSFFNVNLGYVSNSNNQHFYYEIPFSLIDPVNWTYYFQRNSKDNFDMKMWYYNSDNDKYQYTLMNIVPDYNINDYTRVDLTGYQSILLVPKNYPYLVSEYGFIENNVEQIHYSFGYEKCVRPTLIDITTLSNWYSNTQWQQGFVNNIEEITPDNNYNEYCSDSPQLISIDYSIETENNFNYMALLIYNNSILYDDNSQDWVNNQSNPFGQSYVYVNEEYYNYYLISDYNSFNETIDFTDFDNQTTTLYISSLPTFNDLVDMTKSQTDLSSNLSTQQKIDKILSFIKLPFDFFNRTITAECRPLSARFPHGNFDIELPCLSTSFETFMGSALYNVIKLIINGLLTYRVILSLVIFTTKKLDPKDARLEVGALL